MLLHMLLTLKFEPAAEDLSEPSFKKKDIHVLKIGVDGNKTITRYE